MINILTKFREKLRELSAEQIIVLFFGMMILLGACLLDLPIAARGGHSTGFFNALFTSVSAVCVAGFSLCDIWQEFNGFGQAVILFLIEVGGLGFMSTAIVFLLFSHRKITLKQRMVMAQAMGMDNIGGVVRLEVWVLRNSLLVQIIGAILLTFGFLPHYGFGRSLQLGISHAISAFCNCGLDFMGFSQAGIGFKNHAADSAVMIPLALLIIYGGLGFIVLRQIFEVKVFHKMTVYAKLVLITTGILIAAGTLGYAVLEWNNPLTLGPMSTSQKLLAAFFQSVNTRTAGFLTLDQGLMREESKALSCILMLLGGSAGSTSGGIKTVTLAVLVLYILARCKGKRDITVFNRRISNNQVLDAMTITGLMAGLSLIGGVLISVNSKISIGSALFTCISAIATCGLSIPVTAELQTASKILIMLFMFFGRVGILSISLGLLISDPAEERIRRAETKLIIG